MFKIGFKKYYKVLNFTTEIGKHTVGGVGTYMDELYKYHSEDTGFIHIYDENDVQTILLEDYPDTKDILAVSSSEIDQVMYLSYDIAVIHFYALSCLVSEDYIRGRKLVYVVLEAMKEKIPVIVSSNGGMAEIVGDYKYCFNPYFANDMERCIGEFQNDSIDVIEEQRARLFERSKLFTSQKMVENYNNVFLNI